MEKDNEHLHPLNVVLGFFLNEMDAFQYIGDIVNPPFLHLEDLCCSVQIQDPIRRLAQQLNELLCKKAKGCIIPSLFWRRFWSLEGKGKRKLNQIFLILVPKAVTKNEIIYITVTSFIFTQKNLSYLCIKTQLTTTCICISRCTFPKVTGTWANI